MKEIRLKSEQDRGRLQVCCSYFHPLKIDIYMDKGVCSNRKLTESVYDERRNVLDVVCRSRYNKDENVGRGKDVTKVIVDYVVYERTVRWCWRRM